jgi:transcriptional regulator with PAS, ATPase and Fis domain
LFESTLFGYEKGAFTGAKAGGSSGVFEIANRGTLFLDEVGNLPPEMQVKLLRALQEETITKVGGAKPIGVNVRIIAATNDSLKDLVEKGAFREDLYYRLNVVSIKTPSLRERKADIPLLAKNYLENSCAGSNKLLNIETQAMELLRRYDWPGNIRQLFNAIERAGIMATGSTIKVNDLPLEIIQSAGESSLSGKVEGCGPRGDFELNLPLNALIRRYVMHSLSRNGRNISRTAKSLGITRATVYKLINSAD